MDVGRLRLRRSCVYLIVTNIVAGEPNTNTLAVVCRLDSAVLCNDGGNKWSLVVREDWYRSSQHIGCFKVTQNAVDNDLQRPLASGDGIDPVFLVLLPAPSILSEKVAETELRKCAYDDLFSDTDLHARRTVHSILR